MKLINTLAILGALPMTLAALNPGPVFTRLNKNDAVCNLGSFVSKPLLIRGKDGDRCGSAGRALPSCMFSPLLLNFSICG